MATDKKCVTALSINISKVLDAFHHALLMQKLKEYGCNDTSLKVSSSFFDSKRNRVDYKMHIVNGKSNQESACLLQNDLSFST